MKIAIFEEEYKKLLDIKTRVDVTVKQIIHNECIQTEQVSLRDAVQTVSRRAFVKALL